MDQMEHYYSDRNAKNFDGLLCIDFAPEQALYLPFAADVLHVHSCPESLHISSYTNCNTKNLNANKEERRV